MTDEREMPLSLATITVGSALAVVALAAALIVTLVGIGVGDEDPVSEPFAAGAPGAAVTTPSSEEAPPVTPTEAALPTPGFVPTAIPLPTVAPAPTVTPQPTAIPEPTSTPSPTTPPRPTPMAPVPTAPAGTFNPQQGSAGPIHLPVAGGVQVELPLPVPQSHLPGLSAFYVDPELASEVDVFHAYADGTGQVFASFDEVRRTIEGAPIAISPAREIVVDGNRAVVYEGAPVEHLAVGFFTHRDFPSFDLSGWYTPRYVTMWVIDGPSGVVVVTAEWTDGGETWFDSSAAFATALIDSMVLF